MNQQEKIWFKQLHEEKEKHAKVFMLPEYINVWTSVIEKYPESAHFIYELLQNADDANATSVEIKLNEDGYDKIVNASNIINFIDQNNL